MKVNKKLIKILSILALCSQFSVNYPKAFVFEEDNTEEELINIEERQIDEVDTNNQNTGKIRVSARSAIAIDSKTKQVLFEQNSYEVVPMASTTKILTALVAINSGNLDKEVTISKNASSIRGSKVGYSTGEKIKLKELLFGLMFKSGNDAAIAIAEELGGSIEGFSKIMNDYAKSLGLICSHYESPHGLDSAKHYSSAYDLAILTSKAMENELFREICGEKIITKDKYRFTREYQNINKILWKIPTANGVKTGYTGQAGKCLVSSIKHGDRNIIIVVLNCQDRWNQTEKIYNFVESNYAFKKQDSKDIVQSSQMIKLGSIIEDTEFDYGFKGEATIDLEVFKPITTVEKGDILGKISLNENGDEKLKKDIRSKKEISKEAFERIIFIDNN